MYLDKNTFERSFFYIGPGYDIQPLLRFTHLCDTFLYPNLYLNRRPVEEWYDSAFEHAKDIEVLDKRVTRGFDAEIAMECGTDRHASVRNVFKMGHYEYMDFFLKLRNARDLERYSITWRLRRRSTGRVLTLHFFTCEGLEAYAILSQIGRYAPRILCTIETRIFESPRGVLDRFFVDQQRARPILWVRGFAPDLHFPSRHSLNERRRDAFDSVGVFSVRAMSFNHRWSVGRSFEGQRTSERHCFGFMTKEFTRELHEKSWNPEFEDERHKFVTESIANGIARMGNKDVAFISRRLINRFSLDRNHVHSWESILGECGYKQTAAVQIEALRGFVDRLDPPSDAQIHLVQNCLEDENASYLAALRALRHRTVTYCRDLADLLDLKKVALDFSKHESHVPEFSAESSMIFRILDRINVACSDDGRQFVDTTRLETIEQILREEGSPWSLEISDPLFRLYSRKGAPSSKHPVLISSHVTSKYSSYFHSRVEEGSFEFVGTFDNSITNCLVLDLMLSDRLPPDVLVSFTGDGENDSRGAIATIAHLRSEGRLPRIVVVLDVTDDRSFGSPCTLENYFTSSNFFGLPSDEHAFLAFLQKAFQQYVPSVHHDSALPDESWQYEEEGIACVSLCVPVAPIEFDQRPEDWMHSAKGVCVRADLLKAFGDCLVLLTQYLTQRGEALDQ